ncbi:hypothetical protein GLIP_0295 [Aliiglaciecola lipolytica E3]|uniref:Uncharacterized protein n=1 Tax=Aliiglaciecola lipolytica E3 TaxID=1127673 RepID=K6YNM8_9ALTE|nr:hypothetical protein GLIP_0295 [Aliiglaciecola lipolytica E3]
MSTIALQFLLAVSTCLVLIAKHGYTEFLNYHRILCHLKPLD